MSLHQCGGVVIIDDIYIQIAQYAQQQQQKTYYKKGKLTISEKNNSSKKKNNFYLMSFLCHLFNINAVFFS